MATTQMVRTPVSSECGNALIGRGCTSHGLQKCTHLVTRCLCISNKCLEVEIEMHLHSWTDKEKIKRRIVLWACRQRRLPGRCTLAGAAQLGVSRWVAGDA